ncbi:MFS transporter [Caldibacillus lycopersici]|uniref:MFS transporter n=1 Tax=Perspicuibacillus lycopersici TaxID=1325689 RepID=A0AAE3IST6_9BACI|nr:MFS transporter [Perspicuibacillus lycopersici]MCU9612799.1 MFS transporter [Perspicuibacillus lycopersici]
MNANQSKVEVTPYGKEKIWTKDFVLICLANFFVFLGFQMTLPTIPLFVAYLGGNDQLVGFVVGIFTFSALLIRPYAGHALESKGRGLVYLIGLAIFTLSIASFSIAGSIFFLFAMRIVQGVGWGLSTTASGTIASDIIPPKRRGEGLGYYGLSGNLALAMGPSLGLLLVDKITFSHLFLICAVLGVTAFILSSQITYQKVEKQQKTAPLKGDFYEKSALKPSLLLLFITVTFGGIATFLPLYTAQQGIEGIQYYFIIYAFSLMLTRTFAGHLYDRKGHRAIFLPGALLIFIAMLLLAWLPNSFALYIAAILYGLGFGTVQPGMQAWAIDQSPKHRRGMANATFFSFFDIGVGCGAMVFGQIAYWFGYTSIYYTAAGSVLLSMALYLSFLRQEKRKMLKEE